MPVDARIERGRSLPRTRCGGCSSDERFDRIDRLGDRPTPATGSRGDDLVWLLEQRPAEVLILRPAPDDERRITGAAVTGHF